MFKESKNYFSFKSLIQRSGPEKIQPGQALKIQIQIADLSNDTSMEPEIAFQINLLLMPKSFKKIGWTSKRLNKKSSSKSNEIKMISTLLIFESKRIEKSLDK